MTLSRLLRERLVSASPMTACRDAALLIGIFSATVSGVQAAETATVPTDLGLNNVKIANQLSLGCSNTLDAPAASAVFRNFGTLKSSIDRMQARVEVLEKALEQAQTSGQPGTATRPQ